MIFQRKGMSTMQHLKNVSGNYCIVSVIRNTDV